MTPRNGDNERRSNASEPRRPQRPLPPGRTGAAGAARIRRSAPVRSRAGTEPAGGRPWPESAREACARRAFTAFRRLVGAGLGSASRCSVDGLGQRLRRERADRKHHSGARAHSPRPPRPSGAQEAGRLPAWPPHRPRSGHPGQHQAPHQRCSRHRPSSPGCRARQAGDHPDGRRQRPDRGRPRPDAADLSDLRPARIHRRPQRGAVGLQRRRQADRGATGNFQNDEQRAAVADILVAALGSAVDRATLIKQLTSNRNTSTWRTT